MNKILLIEDDNILCELIKEYFNENNYHISYCKSQNKALEIISKEIFDLLLLDVKIENGNGFDLLQQIREQNINTPAIFTTSLNNISDLEKGFSIGCNDYIKKPFAFLRSVCDERTFSFYLVDLLKEYCFIE